MEKLINPYTKGQFKSDVTSLSFEVPFSCYNYACGEANCKRCRESNLLPTINELLGVNNETI